MLMLSTIFSPCVPDILHWQIDSNEVRWSLNQGYPNVPFESWNVLPHSEKKTNIFPRSNPLHTSRFRLTPTRTFVQLLGLRDVPWTQLESLSDFRGNGSRRKTFDERGDGVEMYGFREGVSGVVHDAEEVVRLVEAVHFVVGERVEVVLLTCNRPWNCCNRLPSSRRQQSLETNLQRRLTGHDVLEDDLNVGVSIRSRVFVPKSDHVSQLVHHDSKFVAVLPYGDGLRTRSPFSHEGTASIKR